MVTVVINNPVSCSQIPQGCRLPLPPLHSVCVCTLSWVWGRGSCHGIPPTDYLTIGTAAPCRCHAQQRARLDPAWSPPPPPPQPRSLSGPNTASNTLPPAPHLSVPVCPPPGVQRGHAAGQPLPRTPTQAAVCQGHRGATHDAGSSSRVCPAGRNRSRLESTPAAGGSGPVPQSGAACDHRQHPAGTATTAAVGLCRCHLL